MNDKLREAREAFLGQAERQARRELHDQRFAFLRTLPRRRGLVVAVFALVAAYGVGMFADWPVLSLAALLGYMAGLWALRTATRTIPDLPEELVDERMREVRGRTYRLAYIGAMAGLSVYLVVYIANQVMAKAGWLAPMSADGLHDLSFVLLFSCLALPSSIYAWTEREI